MRCKNCGWPNKPGSQNCSKCGSSLAEAAPAAAKPAPLPSESGPAQSPLGGTVFEGDVFQGMPGGAPGATRPLGGAPNATAPLQSQGAQQKVCPKCGYPLRPDADKCPNCKFQTAAARPAQEPPRPSAGTPSAPGMTRRPTVVGNYTGFAEMPRAMRGTVNPYLSGFQPEFTLTPLARETEVVKPEPQSYTGDSVVLNRDNTEPNNPSITSREQAVITRKGDKWVIQDRSSLGTTFVQATGEIELKPGDRILLGNRIFVFGEKE